MSAFTDDTCILRKSTGPWWDRNRTTNSVICGLTQAEHYYKQGYRFDWDSMCRYRLASLSAADNQSRSK